MQPLIGTKERSSLNGSYMQFENESSVTSWQKIRALHRKNLVTKFGKEGSSANGAQGFCMITLCLGAIICLILLETLPSFSNITTPIWEPDSSWNMNVEFQGGESGTVYDILTGLQMGVKVDDDWSVDYLEIASDMAVKYATNGMLMGTPVYNIYASGPSQAKNQMDKAYQMAVVLDVVADPSKWTGARKEDVDSLLDVSLQMTPWNMQSWDKMVMSLWIALVFQLAMLSVIASDLVEVGKNIYSERKDGMKELMSFLGLTPFDYWASHVLTTLQTQALSIFFSIVVIIITMSKIEEKHDLGFNGGNYFYGAFSYVMFVINTMLFTFALTSLMLNDYLVETYGYLMRSIIPFSFPVILMSAFNQESFGVRFMLLFIPPINFSFALRDSMNIIHADIVLFQFINFFLWGYLTYYFDMTVPTVAGLQQKVCCFCCKSSEEFTSDVAMENSEGRFLEMRNLTKHYGNFTAVDNFSLSLEQNQIYGLLGFNGAGKSTTISMITGMQKASSGSVYIDGKNVATELDSLRKNMGVCPQQNMLWPKLTVRAHLLLFGRLRGLSDEVMESEMETLLTELEMTDVIDVMAKDLSGGQKRKLMVLQAFLGSPTFVLLDEPTAGVDIESRTAIHNLIIRQKENKLIILTTHHMQEADMLSDHIAIMADGKIMVEGTATELKAQHGSGTSFRVPIGTIEAEDFDNFNVTIEAKEDFIAITSKNNGELPQIVKLLESKTEKLHIENNSLESVFLNLARTRAERLRKKSVAEIQVQNELTVREIVSKDYEPAGYLLQFWLLLKKRGKIIFYDPTALIMGVVAILLFVAVNMSVNLMFGMNNQPSQFPNRSSLGDVTIYGTSMDSITNSVIKSNLASFGEVTGTTVVPKKSKVLETPEKYVFEIIGSKVNINVDPFWYPHSISLVSHLYTGSPMEVSRKDELSFLSMIGPMITAMMFCFATTLLMGATYKYTGKERDSGMLNVQRLLGVPAILLDIVNLVYDWSSCILLALVYAGTQADDNSEFGNMVAAWVVASFGYWFLVYALGTIVDADRLLQIMGLLSMLVQIPIQVLNNVQPLYLQWITGTETPPSGAWYLVKILFYFFPAFQFYTSAILLSSKDNLPEIDVSDEILATHWGICWLANLFWVSVYVFMAYGGYERCLPCYKEPNDDTLQSASGNTHSDDTLVADNLSKIYLDEAGQLIYAAKEVSFVNNSGRCLGLLGKNGAGKSTIMSMLTTDQNPTKGEGYVLGQSITAEKGKIRDMIGICNQQNIFWDTFSAREHLTFFGTLRGISSQDLPNVIEVLATELKFIEHLDTKCGYLSGGNKRKLSLCTSIMGCTRVLFLDEPSSGVDPFARDEMQRVLVEMKPGRCILFTSHTMEEAEIMCDDVVILVKGQVECMGTIDKLISDFSEGYFFHIDTSQLTDAVERELANVVATKFPALQPRETTKKELSYLVPFHGVEVSTIFDFMNIIREEDYCCESVLETPSLRELFRNVVNDEEPSVEPNPSQEVEV